MHHYVTTLQQTNFTHKLDGYKYEFIYNESVKYELPIKEGEYYIKVFPRVKGGNNILVSMKADMINNEISQTKYFVIKWQIILHVLFLLISFILAKISLKPMEDTISHLDRFIKDLIHDLNTPSTAILLNSQMLANDIKDEKVLKKIHRIEQSAKSIASLYENLEIFLDKNIIKTDINLYTILNQTIENYKIIYPNIKINIEKKDILDFTNEKAITRIIDNILSNACKYSSQNPTIDITFNDNTLTIKDNGKGIKFPQKIFERSYTENEHGHGVGMHIVHRLALVLDMDIQIDSNEGQGTMINLLF